MADELRFERGWSRMRFRLLSRLEAANARRADVVTVTSEHSRRIAVERYGLAADVVRVVPEGIDVAAFTPAEHRRDGAVILSVARQYPRKNTIALLRAMPRVREAVPSARLRVIGGGPELGRLCRERRARGLEEAIELCGELHGSRAVREAYRSSDVFCLPSLQEGFGIVYLEAMASGLPIVAFEAAAVPEIVQHGRVGKLVPPHDTEGLAAALVELLRDRDLRQRMGRAGRGTARRFDWPQVARRFLAAAAE